MKGDINTHGMRYFLIFLMIVLGTGCLNGQDVNIPDAKFLNALITLGVDTNNDSLINTAEAAAILYLDVTHKEILDLTGIEAFINLDTLLCQYNGLSILDLSACTELTWLNCSYNNLTGLDLTSNVNMLYLECQNNQIESINISNCPQLLSLKCFLNHLTSLDVSGNPTLVDLECYNNSLSDLDVSGNIFLEELACVSNQLTALDLSNNLLLSDLNCADNNLAVLELSNNSALQFLHCEKNQLSNLDIGQSPSLLALECQGNLLSSLDVTKNNALTYLDCQNNQLEDLDVSQNVSLLFLGCGGNQLTALDVYANGALKTIDCSNNNLTQLNLSGNTLLTELRCYENSLTCLDISHATLIERMDCSGNQLVSVDLSNFTGCDWFSCISLRNMPTLLQVCISDLSYSFLISLTGSPNAYFTTTCSDIIPPKVSAEDIIEDQDFIRVTSSEDGTLYLVPADTEKNLVEIRNAALDSMTVSGNIEVEMLVSELPNGIYWLYARDSSLNISEHSPFTVQWVGIESDQLEKLSIFPNPAHDFLSVVSAGSVEYKIEIVSLNGKEMYSGIITESLHTIDLSTFTGGVYIMFFSSGNSLDVSRFVKL